MKKNLFKTLCLVLALVLLPLPAWATSVDTFNANAFNISGGSNETPIAVTIGDHNKAVLEQEAAAGRTAQATVSCPYTEAYVMLGDALVESSVADGNITFDIPTSGDYRIYEGKLFHIANTNMVFGNSLKMNFWIRKSDIQGQDYYAVVTKYYADNTTQTTEISFKDWEDYSGSYYRVSCDHIAAKEMSDDVTVQIFRSDGAPASYVYTDSVRSYAMDMLKYYRSGKLATALVDMLNYGAAAQEHFQYKTDDPANEDLSEAQRALATPSTDAVNKEVKDSTCYGSSLSLKSNIVLNLYFMHGVVEEGMCAEVEFVDHYGVAQTKTYGYDAFCKNTDTVGNEIYGVPVDILVVADGRQPVTCTLYSDAEKTSVVGTYKSSVESYVAIMKQNSEPLYELTLKFVDSAHAYFHP